MYPRSFRPRLEALECRTVPSTFTVGNLADSEPGSLRQAVLDANANPGADIINFADGLSGTVVLSAVYTALDRLEENGLVLSNMGDPTPERGGRAKRFFRVTPAGLKAVRQTRKALTQLWTGLTQLEGGR